MWQVLSDMLGTRRRVSSLDGPDGVGPGFAANYQARLSDFQAAQATQRDIQAAAAQGVPARERLHQDELRLQVSGDDPRLQEAERLLDKGKPADVRAAAKLLTQVVEERVQSLQKSLEGLRQEAAAAAESPDTPPELLRELARDPSPYVRRKVAENPQTPPDVLAALAKDKELQVRLYTAYNPSTPEDTLRRMAADQGRDNMGVRLGVGKNPSAPPDLLRALSRDGDLAVREGPAGNPRTHADDLRRLYKFATTPNVRDSYYVAEGVRKVQEGILKELAANPAAPKDLVVLLAGSDSDAVRLAIARRPDAPPEVLEKLSRLPSYDIQQAVAENPAAPPTLLLDIAGREDAPTARLALARRAQLPDSPVREQILQALVGAKEPEVRVAVAQRPDATPWLGALAKAPETEVRLAVARRPDAPPDSLRAMAGDQDSTVKKAAARNPAMPLEGLLTLAADRVPSMSDTRETLATHPNANQKLRIVLTRDPAPEVRRSILAAADVYLLRLLSGDPDPDIRAAVAEHPKAPRDVLSSLANDGVPFVRGAARGNPRYRD